jgi:hypothetical protein
MATSTVGVVSVTVPGWLAVIVLCGNASSNGIRTILDKASRVARWIGVGLRRCTAAAARSWGATFMRHELLLLFFGLLLLVETGGSSSGKARTNHREGLSEAAVGAFALARARTAASMFNQTGNGGAC